jgi:hypothetical protein
MSAVELLGMPYNQRRIIVVRDDVPPAAPPRRAMPAAAPRRTLSAITPAIRSLLPYASAFHVGGSLALVAFDLIKARREMRQGGENLIPVSSADAAELRFPVGHPRPKVAYIGHPIDPPVYIPVADFHRFLFEHKVAEALRLIRSLGAVTVDVLHIEGWDQSVGVEVGVPIPQAHSAEVGASAGRERAGSRSVLSTMRLRPVRSPSVPADVVWLPHEPLWQEVAQARLESGLDSFVIDVRSTDDYGVNAGLKALVAKAGLEAGGAFVEHRNTIWRLEGTFS